MSFEARITDAPPTVLIAEQLRDGRLAIGTRIQNRDGSWQSGELHFLDPPVVLDLTAWLARKVEKGWLDTIRERQVEPLRSADALYGEGPGAIRKLALDTLSEIPPALLRRAMILLANAIGPEARQRLVGHLNRTEVGSEDRDLRRRLADEHEALGYAVAAAALFDALARGILLEDVDEAPGGGEAEPPPEDS